MSTYLFYTTEGYTQAPDKREIDNCQMLGRAEGETKEEALQRLLDENKWIEDYHYTKDAIVACRVAED